MTCDGSLQQFAICFKKTKCAVLVKFVLRFSAIFGFFSEGLGLLEGILETRHAVSLQLTTYILKFLSALSVGSRCLSRRPRGRSGLPRDGLRIQTTG